MVFASWGHLGMPLGGLLGRLGGFLGRLGAILDRLGVIFGSFLDDSGDDFSILFLSYL